MSESDNDFDMADFGQSLSTALEDARSTAPGTPLQDVTPSPAKEGIQLVYDQLAAEVYASREVTPEASKSPSPHAPKIGARALQVPGISATTTNTAENDEFNDSKGSHSIAGASKSLSKSDTSDASGDISDNTSDLEVEGQMDTQKDANEKNSFSDFYFNWRLMFLFVPSVLILVSENLWQHMHSLDFGEFCLCLFLIDVLCLHVGILLFGLWRGSSAGQLVVLDRLDRLDPLDPLDRVQTVAIECKLSDTSESPVETNEKFETSGNLANVVNSSAACSKGYMMHKSSNTIYFFENEFEKSARERKSARGKNCGRKGVCMHFRRRLERLPRVLNDLFDPKFYKQSVELSPFVLDLQKFVILCGMLLQICACGVVVVQLLVLSNFERGNKCTLVVSDLRDLSDLNDLDWSPKLVSACVATKHSLVPVYACVVCTLLLLFCVKKSSAFEAKLVAKKQSLLRKFGAIAVKIDANLVRSMNLWKRTSFTLCNPVNLLMYCVFACFGVLCQLLLAEVRFGIFYNNPDTLDIGVKVICCLECAVDGLILGCILYGMFCVATHFKFACYTMKWLNFAIDLERLEHLNRYSNTGKMCGLEQYSDQIEAWWQLRRFYIDEIVRGYTRDFGVIFGVKLVAASVFAIVSLLWMFRDDTNILLQVYIFAILSVGLYSLCLLDASASVEFMNAQKEHLRMLNRVKVMFARFREAVELVESGSKDIVGLNVCGVTVGKRFVSLLRAIVAVYVNFVVISLIVQLAGLKR